MSTNIQTMMRLRSGFFLLLMLIGMTLFSCTGKQEIPRYGLAIHGGAGTILRESMSAEIEKTYTSTLDSALTIGFTILTEGGTSIDAVEAVVSYLEDSPLFNAGKGAVFASNGMNELDASIMDGNTLNAGAVSGVRQIRNPIQLARLVMDSSRHVLLYGDGAEVFASRHGMDFVDQSYFYTERRWRSFLNARESSKHGTVGVVCLDKQGNLAAGTSTGGTNNKRFGRIGDSPIIGAGTYANNATCAISATGTGEFFIRTTAASTVSALMELKGLSLKEAMDIVIHDRIERLGGTGGLVGIDSRGNVAFSFNTEGMYRGYRLSGGENTVNIFSD